MGETTRVERASIRFATTTITRGEWSQAALAFSELPTPTNAFSSPYEHECYDTFFYNTIIHLHRIWTSSHHRFVAGVGGVTLVVWAWGFRIRSHIIIGSHSTERRRVIGLVERS